MKNLMILLSSFLKVGFIGFGGGSALIPVIEKEVVTDKQLLSEEDYNNYVIVSNITPGTLPVKLAAAVGRKVSGLTGMLGAALMVSLPGVAITVFLVSIISQLNENVLLQIEYASVGISVFIIFLLVHYIKKVMNGCKQAGTSHAGWIIMLTVFILTGGKGIYNIFGLTGTPLFSISTINILLLSFFIIFYTNGKITLVKGTVVGIIGILFILCTGKAKIISSTLIFYIIEIIMLTLSCYGLYASMKNGGKAKRISPKGLIAEVSAWVAFLVVMAVPASLVFSETTLYLSKGLLSTVISFGGGEAYISIADSVFLSTQDITSQMFYGQILPIANALPGPILSKVLAAIGYYIGLNTTNSIGVGYLLALAGYVASLAASCTVFSIVLYIYNSFENLEIFQILKKWILPIISGLLLSTMVSMMYENIKIFAECGIVEGAAILICLLIFSLLYFLYKKLHWHDIILILVSGAVTIIICNLF